VSADEQARSEAAWEERAASFIRTMVVPADVLASGPSRSRWW
jgi:hypothetical protein